MKLLVAGRAATRPGSRISLLTLAVVTLLQAGAGAAGAPLAMLSNVQGTVQVVRGGKATAGRVGSQLYAGDTVRVVKGSATIFSLSGSPRVLTTGKQFVVGAAAATTSSAGIA